MASEDKAQATLTADLAGAPESKRGSIIENELPTYRAIDRAAIASIVFGGFSVFCYANLYFLVSSVLAVAFGIRADRRIKRLSAELTGRGLAQTGIALGLIFGLTSATSSSLSDFMVRINAERFARKYTDEVLMKGKIADAVWYGMPADVRSQFTTNGAYEKIRLSGQQTFQEQMGGIIRIKERLDSAPGKTKVEFVRLEAWEQAGEKSFALALLRVSGPKTARFPKTEEFAAAEIEAKRGKDGKLLWRASAVTYPYLPLTKSIRSAPPIDDGHGHAH